MGRQSDGEAWENTVIDASLAFLGGNKTRKALSSSSQILGTTVKQLQAKFKHAADFGVTGNWNKSAAGKFNSALINILILKGFKLLMEHTEDNP